MKTIIRSTIKKEAKENKEFLRNCHMCNHLNSSPKEIPKCSKCPQSFLPSNYFKKIHSLKDIEYNELFEEAENISPDLLLKGLTVIW